MKIPPVKTNVITGFLGVGKTTAIQHLLTQKPENETWAILVNEFGEVGIDGSLFKGQKQTDNQQQKVAIKEVPGGCMCCTAGLPMQIAMNQLISYAKPQRLIIEPTGIGHPKEVLSTLAEPQYQSVIDLRATLTLVDARKVSEARYREHTIFTDQLKVADHIVATKADLYNDGNIQELKEFLTSLSLAKTPLSVVEKGRVSMEMLEPASQFTAAVHHHHAQTTPQRDLKKELQEKGRVDISNKGEGFYSHGWMFSPSKVFDFESIMNLLTGIHVERLKAVFITEKGIFGFNKADDVLSCIELDESEDSRLEIITSDEALAQKLPDLLEAAL